MYMRMKRGDPQQNCKKCFLKLRPEHGDCRDAKTHQRSHRQKELEVTLKGKKGCGCERGPGTSRRFSCE